MLSTSQDRVMTAPMALIKIKGVTVGKIKSIRCTENFQRGDIKGIGNLISVEKPILGINCSFSCSSYLISINKLGTVDNPFTLRGASTREVFTNTILLQDFGVDIYIMKRGASMEIENGLVVNQTEGEFFVIKNAFIDSQSFDISEGNISGSDLSGTYLDPLLIAQ